MSLESSVNGLTARARSGYVNLSTKTNDVIVGKGSSVKLVETDSGIYLYWLDGTTLRRGSVNPNLTLSSQETVASLVTAFSARNLQGIGIAYAVVISGQLNIHIGAYTYTSTWPVERLDDFEFDASNDLQTISVLYRRPGSPVQAFVEFFEPSNDPLVTAIPVFVPASGSYEDSVSVTITSATPGAVIYFTVDGSAPTNLSPVYSTALLLTVDTVVRAFAEAPTYLPSAIVTETYVITEPPVATTYIELVKVFDFTLGPQNLPSVLVPLWNS